MDSGKKVHIRVGVGQGWRGVVSASRLCVLVFNHLLKALRLAELKEVALTSPGNGKRKPEGFDLHGCSEATRHLPVAEQRRWRPG